MPNTKNTKKKTPTEITTIDEFFGDFESEYKPFIEWFIDKEEDCKFANVIFVENQPIKYTNKWGNTQWKILVLNDVEEEAYLSGGKRLFQAIMRFCKKEEKLPSDLGITTIKRIGSGFDTRYKLEKFEK